MSLNRNIILIDNRDVTNTVSHYYFKGERCVVIFKNSNKEFFYGKARVKVERTALSDTDAFNVFNYLKEIANSVGLKTEEGSTILSNSYDRIKGISKDCIITAFLEGTVPSRINKQADIHFYPFGFNGSQRDAINNAFSHRLSVIEGPPGTGKTQTILNIIANAIMDGCTIAIVSGNNAATKNVYEKLEKNGLAFIAAVLGSMQNKQEFINTQKAVPDLSAFSLTEIEKASMNENAKSLFVQLSDNLKKQNELAVMKQQLQDFETEYQHFINRYPDGDIPDATLQHTNSERILDLWVGLENDMNAGARVSWFKRLIYFFKFGIGRKIFKDHKPHEVIEISQLQFYTSKIAELNGKIEEITQHLRSEQFGEITKTYTDLTMRLLKANLYERFGKEEREHYNMEDLALRSKEFVKSYPVVLSTTYSLRQSLSAEVVYDYVIIDESSQVDLATGALALSCAKRAVIVGDLKQLPNVVTEDAKIQSDIIFDSYKLKPAYRYSTNSLLSSLVGLLPEIPKTLLREHYRCHPKIIEFCNRKFYNNELVVLTEPKSDRLPLIVYRTVKGNHARERMNQRQVDIIQQEIIPAQQLAEADLGIVTPYRNQTNLLQQTFRGTNIKADTVDKFQGRENDVIILSTVDNEIAEFTDNPNRLNVAISRAIHQLILVVNGNEENNDKHISDLIQYIEYNNFSIIQSDLNSIFDLLYKGYEAARAKAINKSGQLSKFDSENLMYALIKDILREPSFSKYDVVLNFPFRLLIKNYNRLDQREKQYASHPSTHVDFIIYNKLGKRPVLAVEVDGFEYHKKGTMQAERDYIKDTILEKYNLPLSRFRTNESNERERLITRLKEVQGS